MNDEAATFQPNADYYIRTDPSKVTFHPTTQDAINGTRGEPAMSIGSSPLNFAPLFVSTCLIVAMFWVLAFAPARKVAR